MRKSNLIFAIVSFVLVLHDGYTSPWSESNNVIVLTNQNFIGKTKQHDVLLVMFYVKWCSFCRKLHPEYEQAGTKLLQNLDTPVHIAKFDCTNDNEAQCGSRYGITGFPALRIYRYGRFTGEELNYGNRTTEEIVRTMTILKKNSQQRDPTGYASDRSEGIADGVNGAAENVQHISLLLGSLLVLYKSVQ